MDPTGMGYVSKTYSSIIGGGEPMNAVEFQKLVTRPNIKKFSQKLSLADSVLGNLNAKRSLTVMV